MDIQFLSVDPLPLLLPVTIHFRLNFDHFLPDQTPPRPHLLDVINVWPLTETHLAQDGLHLKESEILTTI